MVYRSVHVLLHSTCTRVVARTTRRMTGVFILWTSETLDQLLGGQRGICLFYRQLGFNDTSTI